MSFTLDVWHHTGRADGATSQPTTVYTEPELERLLDTLLQRDQPNPPVLVARERTRYEGTEEPDHLVKIDMCARAGIGAILILGPRDIVPPDAPDHAHLDPQGGVWVTQAHDTTVPGDAPPLYIDKATLTEFPRDAALPLDVWRAALREFMRTGLRPGTVSWQPSEVY
ncbi:Imm1 family immunity protein [Actinosynnema sp. NPDC023587]|uniref:Imm1 family immunity protein n=1 Tax=Actinosynnema sp. NPDC023587 TaxID=3154695 RepID=UPI0033FB9C9D